jgi:hypothetical protein
MRLYLITIYCLGLRYHEVRSYAHSCDAVIDAIDRYPQLCRVSVFCLRRAPIDGNIRRNYFAPGVIESYKCASAPRRAWRALCRWLRSPTFY